MSQTWNQTKAPLVSRYMDAIQNSASPHRPNAIESNVMNMTETNGRPNNSAALRRKDPQQDGIGRSASPVIKKLVSRPTPEELVYSQGHSSQRFPATRPLSRGNETASATVCVIQNNISGNSFQRSPLRTREPFIPVTSGTFQVIPQNNSIDSNDTNWEDDFSSPSCTENSNTGMKITNTDSNFSYQGQTPSLCKQNSEYYVPQQGEMEETTGSRNEDDILRNSNLISIKDRIKTFQKSIIPVDNNMEQDDDSDDKENGETRVNNDTTMKSTTTFGTISQGTNMNTFGTNSVTKSTPSPSPTPTPLTITPTPVPSSKKPAVTASFLGAINKYSPRHQEKKEIQIPPPKDYKPNLKVTIPKEVNDDRSNGSITPINQTSCLENSDKCGMPSPGSSSTLIASWREREASNGPPLLKMQSSFKKVHNVSSSNTNGVQSKYVECDTNSEVGSTGSSLTGPPVIKTMRHVNTACIKSLSDAQLDAISNLIDEQVEARLLHLQSQMEKDFRDKLEKMEARMDLKIKEAMDLVSARK